MPTSNERPDRPLDGRRALVTGGASGIGRATAKRLATDGAAVVVNYVGDGRQADEVVAEIEGDGGRAVAIQGDVSNEGQVADMFSRAREELGAPLDLLVNNAGVEAPYPLEEMPLEEWERVIGVNLTGPFLCSREFVRADPPARLGDRERLVGPRGDPLAAVLALLREQGRPEALRPDDCAGAGSRGIRVVMVAPGAT